MMNIIIAVDTTTSAKDVVLAGKEIAIQHPHASITLLHVLLKPEYYTSVQYAPILGFNEYHNKDLAAILEGDVLGNAVYDFLVSLKEELEIPNALLKIIEGNPNEVIQNIIEESNADILVIGKQNRNASSKTKIGHVTEFVIKNANIPVLVVPTDNI